MNNKYNIIFPKSKINWIQNEEQKMNLVKYSFILYRGFSHSPTESFVYMYTHTVQC